MKTKDNYTLLFNIQFMCFMKRENINRFFKELKKNIVLPNINNFYNILVLIG